MAKWQLNRPGEWDYPLLGFIATDGDILESDFAPDAFWDSVADTGQAETVNRYSPYSGASVPDYTEPTDNSVYSWSAQENRPLWIPGQTVVAQDVTPSDISRVWVDTSEEMFTPSSAFVSLSQTISVPTGYTNGIRVPFQLVSHDDIGYWDATNNQFIAQSDGTYVLRCQISFTNDDTGERWVEIWSSRSGPRAYGSITGHPAIGSVADNYQVHFGPFKFVAGTQFWIMARHTASTNPLALGLNALTWFSIERVG